MMLAPHYHSAVAVNDKLVCTVQFKCRSGDIVIMYKLGRALCTAAARPLLVGFSPMNMKTRVTDNLRQLKHANQRFRSVSISNDLQT